MTILCQDLLWTPAGIQEHTILFCLGDLLGGGGHNLSCFQREHTYLALAAALCGAGHIDGHITAADDNDVPLNVKFLPDSDFSQEIHRSHNALCVLIDRKSTRLNSSHANISY